MAAREPKPRSAPHEARRASKDARLALLRAFLLDHGHPTKVVGDGTIIVFTGGDISRAKKMRYDLGEGE